MATIQSSIQQIADSFVHQVLQALTSASLSELSDLAGNGRRSGGNAAAASAVPARRGPGRPRGSVNRVNAAPAPAGRGRPAARAEAVSARAPARGRGGRRHRRSSEDVNDMAERAAEFVRANQGDGGLAVSDIARGLGMGTAEITRPIAIALQEGKIHKQGEKRLTRYFSGGGGSNKRGRGKKLAKQGAVSRFSRTGPPSS